MNIDLYYNTGIQAKLYEVPRNTVVSFVPKSEITYIYPWMFWHIDGMYSYCTILVEENKGQVFHVSANTLVYIWKLKE